MNEDPETRRQSACNEAEGEGLSGSMLVREARRREAVRITL